MNKWNKTTTACQVRANTDAGSAKPSALTRVLKRAAKVIQTGQVPGNRLRLQRDRAEFNSLLLHKIEQVG